MKKILISSSIALVALVSFVGAQGFTFVNNMSVGANNSDVAMLQTVLIAKGFDIPAISTGIASKGYFGAQTKLAVMKFQAANEIPNTGFVGPLTRAKLNYTGASGLKITNPNGGQVWQQGSTQTIQWTSPTYIRATTADISLVPFYSECPAGKVCPLGSVTASYFPYHAPYSLATGININQNSLSWKIGSSNSVACPANYSCSPTPIQDGQYKIQICESGTTNCDMSDAPFTITTTIKPTVQVLSPNGGEKLVANNTHIIKWSVSGSSPINLDLYLDRKIVCNDTPTAGVAASCVAPYPMFYVLDKNIGSNMVYNWIVATDVVNNAIPAGDYIVRICKAGSTTDCDSSDASFYIGPTSALLQVCPDEKIINRMPGTSPATSYYILNGTRYELGEFDLNWVNSNCTVRETIVY
ncbi:MAG: peptidoglycan-binding protein [bacterium]|nr:peptidoglycan-binding protein [bacterium]